MPAASVAISFEDVYATSLVVVLGSGDSPSDAIVGYSLSHRMTRDSVYPTEPRCTLFIPNTRFVVAGLSPATEYHFKVVSFKAQCCTQDEVPNCSGVERSQSPATNCSSLSNPTSVEDETNHNAQCGYQIVNRVENYLSYCKDGEKIVATDVSSGGTSAYVIPLLDEEHAVQGNSMPSSGIQKLQSKHLSEGKIVDKISTDNGI